LLDPFPIVPPPQEPDAFLLIWLPLLLALGIMFYMLYRAFQYFGV
jgi:hypothetical protein